MQKFYLILFLIIIINQSAMNQEDNYQWLEEVNGIKALDFVREQNTATFSVLSKENNYQSIYNKSLEIANSPEKIAEPTIIDSFVYNLWKDNQHVRGLWRRCRLNDYTNGNPQWETLLDIDALSLQDNVKWVLKGASGLYPTYNKFLVQLSNGGGDAVITKEFDGDKKQFISNGFFIDESKGNSAYVNENTIIVSSNFGEGTMTKSGYPRQVKLWNRGTLLQDAQLIFEGSVDDVRSLGFVLHDEMTSYIAIERSLTFYTSKYYIWSGIRPIELDIPIDCSIVGLQKNQLIIHLKSDWELNNSIYKSGSLISLTLSELLIGNRIVSVIIEPNEFTSISESATNTRNYLLVRVLTNVIDHLYSFTFINEKWVQQKVYTPEFGAIVRISADEFSDQFFFQFESFLKPTTLYFANASNNTSKKISSLPEYFDASKYEVNQYKAKSKDGTLVPYFIIHSKRIAYNSSNPCLLNAYGGFEISRTPFYLGLLGEAWLDKGGVFVLANIRGGGEYGPKWHQAGLKEKRQNVFDDFFAVSEDLISKKITSPQHLGIMGGSNGGLLVGVAFTQRPDLYKAVVCEVPLLDMQRYNKLLAGASWMAEYGNPDIPEEWEYIKKYSPYHNLKKGMLYPELFFITSTRDDRVHPGHARKMLAKMNDLGYKCYYYENTEGGHAGSSTNEQKAKSNALKFSFFLMKLR